MLPQPVCPDTTYSLEFITQFCLHRPPLFTAKCSSTSQSYLVLPQKHFSQLQIFISISQTPLKSVVVSVPYSEKCSCETCLAQAMTEYWCKGQWKSPGFPTSHAQDSSVSKVADVSRRQSQFLCTYIHSRCPNSSKPSDYSCEPLQL